MNNSLKKILKVANKLELKLAQKVSAQAGDIESALKASNLWELSNEVSPLLDVAKVPSDAAVNISINVKPGPGVALVCNVGGKTDSGPAKALSQLLMAKFSKKMSEAIKKANLDVSELVTTNWLKF